MLLCLYFLKPYRVFLLLDVSYGFCHLILTDVDLYLEAVVIKNSRLLFSPCATQNAGAGN